MKTPRFFILLGALALLFTIVNQTVAWTPPAGADPLTIRRADPWAGDPDSPGAPYEVPMDDGDMSSRNSEPYQTESLAFVADSDAKDLPWTTSVLRWLQLLFLNGRR